MDTAKLYHYEAKVRSVYDGDTVRVDIDLGLKIFVTNESVRLNRIDAPEITGEERARGLKSKEYLQKRIESKDVILQTLKDKKGKYGRYIVEVWLQENDTYVNINDEIVSKGFAVYKEY